MAETKKRVEWTSGEESIGLRDARKKLGAALRQKRQATLVRPAGRLLSRPMRQSELARRLGISQTTLGNIEQGNSFPSLPLYICIVRELQLGKIPLVSL
jgi:transcriptional regulator with XRE-family HTH domain